MYQVEWKCTHIQNNAAKFTLYQKSHNWVVQLILQCFFVATSSNLTYLVSILSLMDEQPRSPDKPANFSSQSEIWKEHLTFWRPKFLRPQKPGNLPSLWNKKGRAHIKWEWVCVRVCDNRNIGFQSESLNAHFNLQNPKGWMSNFQGTKIPTDSSYPP